MKKIAICIVLGLVFLARSSMAAIGCTLSNPGQDLKALYPEMTDFKDEAREFPKIDKGKELYDSLKDRLGGDLDSVYETYDTPYTVYKVFKGKELIGIVHGVNVPGKGGVIQVFLAMDPTSGEIKNFIFQRIDSPAAKGLKSKEFRAQFSGLTLADFYKHDYYGAADPGSDKDKVAKIKEPDVGADGKQDYIASVRGVRKNLILLDMFFYEMKFEAYYTRAKEAIAKAKSAEPPRDAKPPEAPPEKK